MDDDLDPDLDEDRYFRLDLTVEFYLKGREDPLLVLTEFVLPASDLRGATDPVEELMDWVELSILQVIDTRGEERYVFTDGRKNKRFVLASEVQSISALAPDPSTIRTLLALTD